MGKGQQQKKRRGAPRVRDQNLGGTGVRPWKVEKHDGITSATKAERQKQLYGDRTGGKRNEKGGGREGCRGPGKISKKSSEEFSTRKTGSTQQKAAEKKRIKGKGDRTPRKQALNPRIRRTW